MALTEMYRRSVDAFLERVARVRTDQWHEPTPCTDWDVRTLVNHIVYEQRWSVPLFAGATIAEVGDRFEGDLLGPDPLADARDAAEGAVMAATEQGTVHLSFGDTPAEEYMRQLFADHVIHGWDLAVGIGDDRTLDPAAVHEISVWFAEREDLYRAAGAIGPRVEVGPDASEQDRLIAGFGRDPYR